MKESLELCLIRGGELRLNGDSRGARLRVTKGRARLAEMGDTIDHVMETGATFAVDRPWSVVVSALSDACFMIEYPLN